MRGKERLGWLIPALALSLPVAFLSLGWALKLLGLNGRVVVLPFWASLAVAALVGAMTLMMLFVQGNLNRGGLRQGVVRRAAVFGGLGAVSPVVLPLLLFMLADPSD